MLIERLDTQTRQVLIEAKLIETRINPSTMKGIDWSGTLAAQNITFGNGNISGTTTTTDSGGTGTLPGGRPVSLGRTESTTTETLFGPALGGVALSTASGFVPATAFLNADGVNAVLSFLNQHAEGRVVSAPRTVTLDNEKSSIEVGTLYPIVNVTAGTANTTGGSQITYSNLTVNLDVTPRISANDYVNLKVRPTVMRLGPRFTTTVAGQANSVDSFLTRTLDTTVLIPSGNTLVMGGLMNDETLKQNTKVPLLGDIPFLGYAFRKDSKSREKNNLIIFVTPTIVTDKDFQPTTTTYLQNPVPKEDTVEPEWSAWDSGKPHDWSKTR
jgi:general secretion pathway protein D